MFDVALLEIAFAEIKRRLLIRSSLPEKIFSRLFSEGCQKSRNGLTNLTNTFKIFKNFWERSLQHFPKVGFKFHVK